MLHKTRQLRILPLLTAGAAALALCGCVSAPFTSTWKAPGVRTLNPAGKTIAVVFISRDERLRRSGEDALAADLSAHKAHGVAAYTLLPDERGGDRDAARERLEQAGVNGVVVMRVVDQDQRIAYAPEYSVRASYSGLDSYWTYGWGTFYQLRDRQSDSLVSVETLVYSLDKGGKLVWASTSRSIDRLDLDSLVREVVDATTRELFRPPSGPAYDYGPSIGTGATATPSEAGVGGIL